MTLAEQVARAEVLLGLASASALRGDLGACQDESESFANAAAEVFPSLVVRLREAESLLMQVRGFEAEQDTYEHIDEFLKGRLSP